MIKFLFHHRSPTLYIVEPLGIIGLAFMAWRMTALDCGWLAWVLFACIVTLYAFIRFCTTKRWYKPCLPAGRDAERYEGIELHFKKALSPTVYIAFLGSLLFIIFPSPIILGIMVFLLAVIAHVNVILIYLHLRDQQDLPVNYFSGNKYVKSEK